MTPLILITGFLGAGKTTLLRTLIPGLRAGGLEPSLILNDHQNARVDAELFRDIASDVRPISGSCVCCGSREELIAQLENFNHHEKSVRLIEANGTTDTPELVEHLTAHPGLRAYTLPIQIAVVDAKRWQKRFWHNELERQQIRTSTHLHLTRREEIKSERLRAVEEETRRIAPQAAWFDAGDFIRELTNLEAEVRPLENRAAFFAMASPRRGLAPTTGHRHAHSHFASAELALPAVTDRPRLEAFLQELPSDVMRAKGLVRFQAGGPWFLFQKVEQSREVQFVELSSPPTEAAPLVILVGPRLAVPELAAALDRQLEDSSALSK